MPVGRRSIIKNSAHCAATAGDAPDSAATERLTGFAASVIRRVFPPIGEFGIRQCVPVAIIKRRLQRRDVGWWLADRNEIADAEMPCFFQHDQWLSYRLMRLSGEQSDGCWR